MATANGSMGAAGREMTVGTVMSRAFAAIGAAPALFFGVSFVLVALPATALGFVTRAVMQPATQPAMMTRENMFTTVLPAIYGTLFVWWILYMAAQAVLIRATVAEIDRRPQPLGEYLAGGARALLPLIGLSILLSLAVWVGFIALIVPGVMLAMMWSVAAPALVVERCGVFGSFGRSRRLTKGARWRILGLVLIVFVIYFMASGIVGAGNIAMNGLPRAGVAPAQPPLYASILSALLQTAFVAVWTAIQAALYVELRDWKDGPAGERLADIFA